MVLKETSYSTIQGIPQPEGQILNSGALCLQSIWEPCLRVCSQEEAYIFGSITTGLVVGSSYTYVYIYIYPVIPKPPKTHMQTYEGALYVCLRFPQRALLLWTQKYPKKLVLSAEGPQTCGSSNKERFKGFHAM